MSHHRTLWEEGRRPGRLVAAVAGLVTLLVVALDLAAFGRLTLLFDLAFVIVCVAAALLVRPRDFFVVGVLPPLLMAATVTLLAFRSPSAVADARDGVLQAVVSGLAHHSGALVAGYLLTLGLLAVRQVALRHAGRLRGGAVPASRPADRAPALVAVPQPVGAAPGPVPEQHDPEDLPTPLAR